MMRPIFMGIAVIGALFLAVLQCASDASYSRAATRASLPAHLPCALGSSIYGGLGSILRAAYTAPPLVACALEQRNIALAQSATDRLPPSPERSELEGKIARAQGRSGQAAQAFLAAGDAGAVENEVDALTTAGELQQAFRLEAALRTRMLAGEIHPDAVADIDWKLNVLATRLSRRQHSHRTLLEKALAYDREAVALSPYAERYWLAEGNRLLDLHQSAQAAAIFRQIRRFDPASADALAGLGLAALQRGDTAWAHAYADRSRAENKDASMLRVLDAKLQSGR